MSIIAGCYERFLFGFTYPYDDLDNTTGTNNLTRTFTHAAHKGIVKSLASAGPFVASGGTDDLIHLYDLKDDKDLGFLMNPAEGSITALRFFVPKSSYTPTHLLAGCSDGTLSIWKAGGGWECMKTLRGHRKDITGIAIHPSGCLALTTSADKTLRLWDLIKGRTTFCTKLEKDPDSIAFSPNGVLYALHCGSEVVIRPVASGMSDDDTNNEGGKKKNTQQKKDSIIKLEHSQRIQSMIFTGSDSGIVITGTEDGSIRLWDAQSGKEILSISKAHATRIKALAIPYSSNDNDSSIPRLVASASSDGIIKLWDMHGNHQNTKKNSGRGNNDDDSSDITPVCIGETNTKARVTVLCTVDPVDIMVMKMKEAQKERQQIKQVEKKRKKTEVHEVVTERKKEKKPVRVDKSTTPSDAQKKKKSGDGVTVKGGVVSFMDEEDREKERKKQRQVKTKAKRVEASSGGQKRRNRMVGK